MIIKINGLSEEAFKRIKATLSKRWKKDSYVESDGLYYVTLGESVIFKTATGRDYVTLDLGGVTVDINSNEFVTIKIC